MGYETDHVCPTKRRTNERAELLTILALQVAFFDIYRHFSTRGICPGNVVVTEVFRAKFSKVNKQDFLKVFQGSRIGKILTSKMTSLDFSTHRDRTKNVEVAAGGIFILRNAN